MSYTVIGDQVNLGARLESLNKDFHTRVIISDATRAALKGRYDIRALGEVVVKGKSVPVKIFSVVPPQAVVEGLNADALSTDIPGKRNASRAVARTVTPVRSKRRMKSTVMATIGVTALALLGPGAGLGAPASASRSVGVGAETRAADARHPDDRRGRAEAGRSGQRADSGTVWRRAGPGHSQVRDAGRRRALAGEHPSRPASGGSSCSTPTASTRWPRQAVSCTSRAARCRSSRAKRSWPACSGTRLSTSPRSTPSRQSRRARW